MIAFLLLLIFINFVLTIHINAKTFQALLPHKIAKDDLKIDPFIFISQFFLDSQVLQALSSRFGIDNSKFTKGLFKIENNLPKVLRSYQEEIAYLEGIIENFTDKRELVLLRMALSHHGAIADLNETEQKNLLALLTKIDLNYQRSFCSLPKDGNVVKIVPISEYEYFSLSFLPVLSPTYKYNKPGHLFCFSILDLFLSKYLKRSKKLIPHVPNLKPIYQNLTFSIKELSIKGSNKTSMFLAKWERLSKFNFKDISKTYPKDILNYLKTLMKASIFGDIPTIPETNRDPLVILKAFGRCINIFLFQLRLHKRRVQIFKIDPEINLKLIEALENYYKFLLESFNFFKLGSLSDDSMINFYRTLLPFLEQELLSLKRVQPSLPASVNFKMAPFTDISLEKAFVNVIKFPFGARVMLENCLFGELDYFFDRKSDQTNQTANAFENWQIITGQIADELDVILKKQLPDRFLGALVTSHFYFQSLYIFSFGRFFDLSFAQSINDRINLINSIPFTDFKFSKDFIRMLGNEINSLLKDDEHAGLIKLDACYLSNLITTIKKKRG